MNEESKLIELFKKYPGIAATIIDYTTEYMEESMGWPDADDQTTFNNQIANN